MAKAKLTPEQQVELNARTTDVQNGMATLIPLMERIIQKMESVDLDKDLDEWGVEIARIASVIANPADRAKELGCGTIKDKTNALASRTTITHDYDGAKLLSDHPEVKEWSDCVKVLISNVAKRGIPVENYRIGTANISHSIEPTDSLFKQRLGYAKSLLAIAKFTKKPIGDVDRIDAMLHEVEKALYD